MYRTRPAPVTSRRGVILLVVVSLLTLFAIVGLSFVMYAEAEAKGAQTFRDATILSASETEPEMLLAYFLNQLIYDVADTEPGVYSALRGHSLLRSMYGWNDESTAVGTDPNRNRVEFNGTARLHERISFGGLRTVDGYDLINYTCFRRSDGTFVDGLVRDPERPGVRRFTPGGGRDPANPLTWLREPFTGGYNAP